MRLWNWFVKLTAWPVYLICFKTRIYYEDKSIQSRKIKKDAIIMCNHTSVYDYAVMLFCFFSRTLRVQMAEVLFEKKGILPLFLKMMGGIKVDRESHNFDYLIKSKRILNKGGVVGVFPESRIPKPEEEVPLEFKPSITYLALEAGSDIIPVYTNGSYFKKSPARVIIGKPINVRDLYDDKLSEKENIDNITKYLREKTIDLKKQLEAKIMNK